MGEETFAFRGLGRFIIFGMGVSLAQVVAGLRSLRDASRGKSVGSWLGAVWLIGSGLAGAIAFLSCRNASVRLTENGVEVHLGRLWNQTIPYRAIAAAVPADRSVAGGLGIRMDSHGAVAIVLWGRQVVALDLSPPRDLPVFLFIRQRDARRLMLGVEDRDRFVAAVMQRVLSSARSGA
jgi:hypothetical protein